MACDQERAKALERARQPILSFTHEELADPATGSLIRDAIGAEALHRAFGPDGGGIQEIRANCALVNLTRALRKREKEASEETEEPS